MKKRVLSCIVVLSLIMSTLVPVAVFAADSGVAIIYTNDVHCELEADLGYATISAMKKEFLQSGKGVILADIGDAIQGDSIGSLSKGEYIVDIMNHVGYDVSAVGNHEFDYGIEKLMELRSKASYKYLCSNFIDIQGKEIFEPYTIIESNGLKIAFIGVTTPHTYTSVSPATFQNENGEYIYEFYTDEKLYEIVQENVTKASNEGADIVIVLAHLGIEEGTEPHTSIELIENTTGIDAVIDGHSHSIIDGNIIKNKNGEEVVLTSTGTKFKNIGIMNISADGKIETELKSEYSIENLSDELTSAYSETNNYISEISKKFDSLLNERIAATEFNLTIYHPSKTDSDGNKIREVRRHETNLANFCADAYKYALGCDVAIINGGGVRADIAKGDISYGDLLAVNPFGNNLCVIEVKGKTIIDALEMGVKDYPGESGGFLHASGLTYEIDTATPSAVVLDEKGNFATVNGEYRVKNIRIKNEPIDTEKTYTLGGSEFTLLEGGDGFSMFPGSKLIKKEVCTDCEALISYVNNEHKGVIGARYENPQGDGRIKIINSSNINFDNIKSLLAKDYIKRALAATLISRFMELINK